MPRGGLPVPSDFRRAWCCLVLRRARMTELLDESLILMSSAARANQGSFDSS
jgi:hypothetical protein